MAEIITKKLIMGIDDLKSENICKIYFNSWWWLIIIISEKQNLFDIKKLNFIIQLRK